MDTAKTPEQLAAEELERQYQAGKRGDWENDVKRKRVEELVSKRKSTRRSPKIAAKTTQYNQRVGTFTMRLPNWAIEALNQKADALDLSRNELIVEVLTTWLRLQSEGDSELLPLVPRGILREDLPSHLDPSPVGLEDSYA